MSTYIIAALILLAMCCALFRVIKNSLYGKCSCGCGGNCPGCEKAARGIPQK